MHSFWEQTNWLEADVVIIGAGLVGVQTSIEYLAQYPGKRVIVLERGLLPCGASTRNAGFACFGSLSEIASDIDLMGASSARDLVRARIDGLNRLRARCRNHDIGFLDEGGHEIFTEPHSAISRIDEINNIIEPIFGAQAFAEKTNLVCQYGLSDSIHTLIRTPYEATIDSGKLVNALWSIAQQHGARICTGAEAIHVDDHANGAHVTVRSIHGTSTLIARHVVLAANAWIPGIVDCDRIPAIRPGRGQVLVTKPIQDLRLRGSFHYDEGYYYFRRVGNRVLLGGGRNLDFEGEQTTSHEVTPRIQSALENLLRTVILPKHPNIEIEHRWAGTMAFTDNKQPFVKRVQPRTVVAFGCNGMGVALSSSIAISTAALLD